MYVDPDAQTLAPNDYRQQLASGTGLDGLGTASYILNGGTADQPANPSYFGLDSAGQTFGANTSMMFTDGNGTLYFYHPGYINPVAQQATVGSLGLSSQALDKLTTSLQKAARAQGFDPLSVTPQSVVGWIIIAVGVALVAAGILFPPAEIAGDVALEGGLVMTFEAAIVGVPPLLAYGVGGGLILGGFAYMALYPNVSNNTCDSQGNCCWNTTDILGSQTTCVNPTTGQINSQPTSPSIGGGLMNIAWGLAAIVGVGVVGYTGYRLVKYLSNRPRRVRAQTPTPTS